MSEFIDHQQLAKLARGLQSRHMEMEQVWDRAVDVPFADEPRWHRIKEKHVKLLLANLVMAQCRLSELAAGIRWRALPCLGITEPTRARLDLLLATVNPLVSDMAVLMVGLAAHDISTLSLIHISSPRDS